MEVKVYFGSEKEMRAVLEAAGSGYDDRVACADLIEKIGRASD